MITDKWHRRCCYNCRHHLDFHLMGRYAETVVCAIRARKDMGNYIGVDYDHRLKNIALRYVGGGHECAAGIPLAI